MKNSAKIFIILLFLLLPACDDAPEQENIKVTVHGTSDNASILVKYGPFISGMKEREYKNVSLPFIIDKKIPKLGPCPDKSVFIATVTDFDPGCAGTITFEIQHEGRELHVTWENNDIEVENDLETYGASLMLGGDDSTTAIGVGYTVIRDKCLDE